MYAARSTRFATALLAAAALAFVAAPARADIQLPGGGTVQKVDFERHLMGVFGRMGCNAASCHGSFQGKGGLRLSLFGYDPEKDYVAFTRDLAGRRINFADPDASLLLLKATGQVAHGGQKRFSKDSWAYQMIREWIVAGAPWQKGSGDIASVAVNPPEYAFTKPGLTGQLRVEATFSDGSKEDITPLCDFRSNDDAVIEVNRLGEIKALQPGDTAVIVSYRGAVVPVRVLAPLETGPDFHYPNVPENNYVDHEVFAKLKRLNIAPSDLANDSEFLRRVTLDVIGSVPTPKEVRDFLADARPDKRAVKIDELLENPRHAALWATKLCDITGDNTDQLENPQQRRPKLSQMWHDWFQKRLAANTPYDEIVHGVLCATSRDKLSPEEYVKQYKELEADADKGWTNAYADKPTLDLYWRRQQAVTPDQWGEKTAAAFLGVRVECAQCHKHPFDRWTQVDYRAYANIFASVNYGVSPDAKKVFDDENAERKKMSDPKKQIPAIREVFVGPFVGKGAGVAFTDPQTKKPLAPKALGGPEIKTEKNEDPRQVLFDWMRSPDNPYFARSFANRVWEHYFGVGVVNPVDNFSLANPPSNPKLLDALAKDFIDGKFDVRRLERTILNSRTYQLSSSVNAGNRQDRINYSHSYPRQLMAEIVLDMLDDAVGSKEKYGADAPPDARAIEIGASRVGGAPGVALRVFGRPSRVATCDCERSSEPALSQKLYLMADDTLLAKIGAKDSRLQQLLADHKDDNEALDELFLATVARLPMDHERDKFTHYRESHKDRRAAFNDVLYALVNTSEFILNH